MNDEIDETIDRLLRDTAPCPVADEGFCAGLIAQLPPRRRRIRWPLGAGIAAGVVACWISMRSAQIAMTGWHDWVSGNFTAPALALVASLAGLSLLTMAWTIAEVRDQAV